MGVAFVDFMKVFNTVSHNILIQKLENVGIAGGFLLWLKDFLANRTQFVSIEGKSSELALEYLTASHCVGTCSVLNVY